MPEDHGEQEMCNLELSNAHVIVETKCHKRVRRSREFLEHFLHLTKVEFAIIFLVLLDVIVVMTQLVIELYACKTKLSEEYHERLETVAKVFHFLSISFICVFVIEIFLKIFALGGRFFKSKLNIADAFVVLISLVLDVVFIEEDAIQGLGAVVTALRVWRIFRIITSAFSSCQREDFWKNFCALVSLFQRYVLLLNNNKYLGLLDLYVEDICEWDVCEHQFFNFKKLHRHPQFQISQMLCKSKTSQVRSYTCHCTQSDLRRSVRAHVINFII